MNNPLVSIIIPTFNRAHLIGETLDSIIAQTYTNWECIIVDDGSTDNTEEVVSAYLKKDSRFQYHHRPDSHKPGGNGARNYGFSLSKGEYINWFDSDDLMLPNFILYKLKPLESNIDFVVSKTKFLNHFDPIIAQIYNFNTEDVNFDSFSMGNVNWSTPDLLVKKSVISDINFNEDLRAGQEYNFNCKLLVKTNKMFFLDKFLTLRRIHNISISTKRKKDIAYYLETKFETHWITYLDLVDKANNVNFNKYSLLICISSYLRCKKKFEIPKGFNRNVYKTFKSKIIFYYLSLVSNLLFGKYHFFYNKLKHYK